MGGDESEEEDEKEDGQEGAGKKKKKNWMKNSPRTGWLYFIKMFLQRNLPVILAMSIIIMKLSRTDKKSIIGTVFLF